MITLSHMADRLEIIETMLREQGDLLAVLQTMESPQEHRCDAACSCRQQMKGLLREVVQVLEDSRRSFKSRQLETLRHRLMDELTRIA